MDIVVVLDDLLGNLVTRRMELQQITTLLLTGGTQFGNDVSIMNNNTRIQPQTHSFTFQSCTITYGASNRAYHISSTTRRTGSDGLRFEEYKEADSVTYRLSRGVHDKMVSWIQCKCCTSSVQEKLGSICLVELVELKVRVGLTILPWLVA